ncbi:unnamed protein product [Parnassius apollo]|uniref:(apollo) hypothetical protein n=1 Tax=Parnassius apollo TaxID=110799 RepID=A0A8S3WTZ4_PARAO|nr:unnamed protein product [Parnassius apollo]
MAFSLRKMLSNITYFKKPDGSTDNSENQGSKKRRHTYVSDEPVMINFECAEPDSTSRQCTSLNIPESVKKFAAKKASFSDTDLLTLNVDSPVRQRRKRCKKLKLDIKKASQSMTERLNHSRDGDSPNIENTPKHILLECVSSDIFSEKLKGFDFSKSFDFYDGASDDQSSPFEEENFDIESLSDHSDSDVSVASNKKKPIKMCRKVEAMGSGSSSEDNFVASATPESFDDIEIEKSEKEEMKLLHNYQMKLEKIEGFIKNMLNEFQFHIEVSKIFNSRIESNLQKKDTANIAKDCSVHISQVQGISPTESWSFIMEKEDGKLKIKVKEQLESIKHSIEEFIKIYLENYDLGRRKCRKYLSTFDIHKGQHYVPKRVNMSNKKKIKHYDFPDLREAMINLFYPDSKNTSINISTSDSDDSMSSKCTCQCHRHTSSLSHTDSGLTNKTSDGSISNQSITSSIGNFSLDSTTLTAFSESLDQIVSYNSFQDTSLYNVMHQKAAIERITFYVQVHSIQLKCDSSEQDFESKNVITFHCPSCKTTESDENSLLKHILSQTHCEKIHFQYKTAYIKKCVSAGKEIQPSTVLNPMKMYRDDNKIVCFGDAMYACSLCFENLIIGESVLMAHCVEKEHVERREKLSELLE